MEAVCALQSREWGGRRPQYLDFRHFLGCKEAFDLPGPVNGLFQLLAPHQHARQRDKGRVMHQTAKVQLLFKERNIILGRSHLNGIVFGVIALHDHFSRQSTASRTPRHLGQELKCSLRRAKIRKTQLRIGGGNSNQSDTMKVVSFGNHLRPHQNVNVPSSEVAEYLGKGPFMAHGIAVEAGDASLREKRAQVLLHLFSACADKIDMFGIALRTDARYPAREAAVVARQTLTLLVISERDTAILTQNSGAAAPAEHEPGIATAIDQHNGLPSPREFLRNCCTQILRNRGGPMSTPEILAQVGDLYCGHGPIFHARSKAKQLVLSLARSLIALQGRGGRAEQSHRPFQFGPHEGHVASVVTWRFFLLVARFLLLVDDDQSDGL